MAKFMTPVIQDNPSGWGPCAVPEQFKDMPYQPFSKGDRLGKVPVLMLISESLEQLVNAHVLVCRAIPVRCSCHIH